MKKSRFDLDAGYASQPTLFPLGEVSGHAADLGLSFTHTPTRGVITTYKGGSLVKLSYSAPSAPRPRGQGKRGKIRGFSRGARGRLMQTLGKLDPTVFSQPMMVTLTYPAVWAGDAAIWKNDLDMWHTAMKRRYGPFAAVWKMEYQKRGAPHFHVLIFSKLLLDLSWVSEQWYKVVGSGDPKHLAAGVRCEYLRSFNGAMWYASKYIGKLDEYGQRRGTDGRHWGTWGRYLMGIVERRVVLSKRDFIRAKRWILQMARRRGRNASTIHPYDGLYAFLKPGDSESLTRFLSLESRQM